MPLSCFGCARRVLDAANAEERSAALDVNATISELRTQRVFMVQTDAQFMFCYLCVLDGLWVMLDEANHEKWPKEVQVRESREGKVSISFAGHLGCEMTVSARVHDQSLKYRVPEVSLTG